MIAVVRPVIAIAAAFSAALLIGSASPVVADDCRDTCAVGGAGTGGENSDGQARGFYEQGPGRTPGVFVGNSGNDIAGHIEVSGAREGEASGALNPQDDVVGHYTGVFGDCSGVCNDAFD